MSDTAERIAANAEKRIEQSWMLGAANKMLATEYNEPGEIRRRADICLACPHVKAEPTILMKLFRFMDNTLTEQVSCGKCGCAAENKLLIKSIRGKPVTCPDTPPRW